MYKRLSYYYLTQRALLDLVTKIKCDEHFVCDESITHGFTAVVPHTERIPHH